MKVAAEGLGARMSDVAGRAVRCSITAYRRYLSPLLGTHCRFYPSCSAYAYTAITRHGVFAGGLLAVKRLLRCHPFHPGGVDFVPELVPEEAGQGGD